MIKTAIQDSIKTKQTILSSETIINNIQKAVDIMVKAIKGGNKVIFCGNGGSAADAQHLAAELVGRFYKERKALPAIALNTNTSAVTAIGNDYSYDDIFLRQAQALAQKGDVIVGISTSGNSKNVIKALEYCKNIGVNTVCLTGKTGGEMKQLSDILINVPSDVTPRIQEAHITLGHIICELVEKELC